MTALRPMGQTFLPDVPSCFRGRQECLPHHPDQRALPRLPRLLAPHDGCLTVVVRR